MKHTRHVLGPLLACVLGFASVGRAVDGISVTVHWTGSNDNLYGGYGAVWRHDIQNDEVTAHTKLYDGPARHPVISPDGTKVAFIKQDGWVCVMSVSGGTPTQLVQTSSGNGKGVLDWPAADWIYYNGGGYSEPAHSKNLRRVHPDGSGDQAVFTFKKDNGTDDCGIWHFNISADLTRAAVRPDDTSPAPYGTVTAHDMSGARLLSSRSIGQSEGDGYRCSEGIDPGGDYVMIGDQPHTGMDVCGWSDLSTIKTVLWSSAVSWGPDTSDTGTSSNRNRWCRNSSKWVCIHVGWGIRGTNGANQMLINWQDEKRIVVTENQNNQNPKQFDCAGDFWVGSLGNIVRIDSFTASPATIAEGQSSTLSWSTANATSASINQGVGTVNVNGSVSVSPTVTTTYTITVQGEGGPNSQQVTVTVTGPAALHLKINCGDNTVAGWENDGAYATAGDVFTFGGTPDTTGVTNAAPGEVYHTCRHEAPSYSFPAVPDGTYLVRIHFYDEFGDRSMKVDIEGQTRLTDYGFPTDTAVVEDLAGVEVSDGDGMQVVFSHTAGVDSFCSGIEIIDGSVGAVLSSIEILPPAVTLAPGGSQLFMAVPKDQYDDPITATISWSVSGGGSMSPATGPTSTFTSDGTEGSFTVTAASGAVQGLTGVTVTAGTVASISLVAPNGGEVWYVGTTPHVRWTTVDVDNVALVYSTDGGDNFAEVIPDAVSTGTAEWEDLPWTIPDTPSTRCRVFVMAYLGDAGGDGSDGDFEIRVVTDGDGDGMDDGWESDHFGNYDHDGTLDTDGDGTTDLDEFMAATDPTVSDGGGDGGSDGDGDSGCGVSRQTGAPGAAAFLLALVLLGLGAARRLSRTSRSSGDSH